MTALNERWGGRATPGGRASTPLTGQLTEGEARRLGDAIMGRGGHYALKGEVRSLVDESADDGSWVCGTLIVRGVPVRFVATDVPGLQVGRDVLVEGRWKVHPPFGLQFVVTACRRSELPAEREGVVRYLAANVAGVGEARARRLVDVLGAQGLLARLAAEPALVRGVLAPKAAGEAEHGLHVWRRDLESERWCLDAVPALMGAAGVGYALARRIANHFDGPEVADLLARRNPYRLLEVPGLGWDRADAIARRLGVPADDEARLEAAVLESMRDLGADHGHTGVPVGMLVEAACGLAGGHEAAVRAAVVRLGLYCEVRRARGLIFLPEALEHEFTIAGLLDALLTRRYALGDGKQAIERVIARARPALTAEQADAIRLALTRGVAVLTGGPGTGKTHALGTLVKAATALGLPVQIVAPTGKAASRASEKTGHRAATIHRFLGGPLGGTRAEGLVTRGLLVVEEASMLDAETAAWLASNVAPGPDFRLLFVGDEGQLASVGPGRVLSDLLESGVVPCARLTQVQRQRAGSRIVQQAYRLVRREPLLTDRTHDWEHVALPADPDAAHAAVLRTVRRVIWEEGQSVLRRDRGFDPRCALQVLSPRVPGPLGVGALNAALRDVVNPRGGAEGPYLAGADRARAGDRVMCVRNDYTLRPNGEPGGVMNGEQGVVEHVSASELHVLLDDGRRVVTRGVQNKSFALAFATTVHKSQGSEYPVVLLVFHRSHGAWLDQRLLYTAITRAAERLVLCADAEALRTAEARGASNGRFSGLAERIRSDHRLRTRRTA